MKKVLSVVLAMLLLFSILPISVFADGAEEDYSHLTYTTYQSQYNGKPVKRVSIKKCDPNFQGELVIPEKIEGNDVVTIGDSAFVGCNLITSVVIPKTVKKIYGYAFRDCTGIETLTISDKVTRILSQAFSGCNIKHIIIADGSTQINSSMIVSESTLEKVTMPDTVKSIGSQSFFNCKNLKEINLSKSLKWIYYSAFYGCSSLESVVLPENVKYLGSSTFEKCTSLKEVKLNEKLEDIYSYAFAGCKALESIEIPESVDYMGSYVFINCKALKSVTLPDKLKYIYNCTFYGCEALKKIDLPKELRYIGRKAFYKTGLEYTKLSLPENVYSIGYGAFDESKNIKSVYIPYTVTSISNKAFDKNVKKIYGYKNTRVESFAKDHNIKFVSLGIVRLKSPEIKVKNGYNNIRIEWNKVKGATRYLVYRKTYNDGKWSVYQYIGSNYGSCSYNDYSSTAKGADMVKYTVRSSNGYVKSEYEGGKKIIYLDKTHIRVYNEKDGIRIKWSEVEGATKYRIYRRIIDGKKQSKYEYFTTTKASSYLDTSKAAKKADSVIYYVHAARSDYRSQASNYVEVEYIKTPQSVKAKKTTKGIRVTWKKVSQADYYSVFRSVYKDGEWSALKELGAVSEDATSYVDKTAKKGVKYKYTVKAFKNSRYDSYDSGYIFSNTVKR